MTTEPNQRWVLVVDDDPGIRELVRDVVELAGYAVLTVEYGSAALAALRAGTPACVVLDVMMPGMSGLEVLSAIRAEPAWSLLPVLLLTAATDDETTWAGWNQGADCYLAKPFDPDALLRWIDLATGGGELPVPDPRPAYPLPEPLPSSEVVAEVVVESAPEPPAARPVDVAALYFELATLAGRFAEPPRTLGHVS